MFVILVDKHNKDNEFVMFVSLLAHLSYGVNYGGAM